MKFCRREAFLEQWLVWRPQWSSPNERKLQKPVRALRVSKPPGPVTITRLMLSTSKLFGSILRRKKWENAYASARIQRRVYWWLDGEAPKNNSKKVGQGRRFKRSCQTLRGVSRKAPSEMRISGPLYLTIIQRPKTEVWYAKSKMGEHKLGSIMITLTKTLNVNGKRIPNHSTRKSVVAKLKIA